MASTRCSATAAARSARVVTATVVAAAADTAATDVDAVVATVAREAPPAEAVATESLRVLRDLQTRAWPVRKTAR